MPLALTCDCGARFEVAQTLPGQEVVCPECLQALKAPARKAPARTSLVALASLVLALVGAFTMVGTLTAVLVGVIALVQIRRNPDRQRGAGYAVLGIVAGAVLTVVSVVGLWSDLVPIKGWVRQRVMTGQIETAGPLEVTSADGSCTLTRPSSRWGRARGDVSDDPAVSELQKNADVPFSLDLLLIHPGRHAYVDVHRASTVQPVSLSEFREILEKELTARRSPLLGTEDGSVAGIQSQVHSGSGDEVAPVDGHVGQEWRMELTRGGLKWTFLVRAYRKEKPDPRPGIDPGAPPQDAVVILRGYCPAKQFRGNEAEIRRVLDSVRFTRFGK